MPYQKHNRYISDEQFSDETTIDGSRMDNAMQDVQDLVNSIPKGDLENRYTQTQFVMGWSPSNTWRQNEADTGLPWLNAVNSDLDLATVTGGTPGPPESYQNPQRAKGYATRAISPALPESFIESYAGKQYIWATPIHFNKSVIIQSLKLFLLTDSNSGSGLYPYQNSFGITYDSGATTENAKDLSVQIIVDRPAGYGSEDRRLNQVLANKQGFEIANSKINQTVAAPTADMFPDPYPGGNLKGAYCDVTVNEPIPSGSRIRVCVIIPDYSGLVGIASGWDSASGAEKPWLAQYYSATLTVLEELER
jgi:hypothetical protein